ncbi:hypothetical protein OGAPHI_005795 [Ogataea philodendri]|uniref:Uncharacterized protein n=1 Tax=Ogataea philodendri TaxID=1378263 RepID=A0A9P8NYG2_9ASCO|nr:uncharacterized protein OGAPHI_005795 [Ogataea philodendri]KAH3662543.1 hypothetical protein OGAPHI_005795 [Ogataea philodendri]
MVAEMLLVSLRLSRLAVVSVVTALVSVWQLVQFEWSWDVVWLANNIKRFVDLGRDRLDLCAELLLDFVQVEPVVPVDEVDGDTKVAESSRSADSVKVCFCCFWEVKVHHHVDGLDIDTSGEEVGTHQVSDLALSELVEDLISGGLRHLGMRVVARVVQLCDFLGEKLHSVGGVTEDDGLVDLQFREQRVETVKFLFLLHERVVLRDTLQSQLVHQIDLVGLRGKNFRICTMMFLNSRESILSASSMTNMRHSSNSASFLEARSKTLPGVPTRTCTGSWSLMISSLNEVPPVVTMTWIPKWAPRVFTTCDVWRASSLVGTRIRACILLTFGFNFSRVGITNAAVLPVPFFALARMSLPMRATGIASSWMGDGFSKPASKIPIKSSLLRWNDSNVLPLVDSTSSVWGRPSFFGRLRLDFQSSDMIVILEEGKSLYVLGRVSCGEALCFKGADLKQRGKGNVGLVDEKTITSGV